MSPAVSSGPVGDVVVCVGATVVGGDEVVVDVLTTVVDVDVVDRDLVCEDAVSENTGVSRPADAAISGAVSVSDEALDPPGIAMVVVIALDRPAPSACRPEPVAMRTSSAAIVAPIGEPVMVRRPRE
jgi:hypothetical protein